jgi:hypothetical protein
MNMKFGKLAVLGAVLAASAPFASAAGIQLGSYCSSCTAPTGDNNTGLILAGVDLTGTNPGAPVVPGSFSAPSSPYSSATFNLAATSPWAGPLANSSWVGVAANANPGGVNPPYGYYEFTSTFTGAAGSYLLNLSALADDTVAIFIDGVAVVKFPNTDGGDTTCSDNPTGCLASTQTNITNFAITLAPTAGVNTIELVVQQAGTEAPGTDPSGVDFDGTLNAVVTPEPDSLVLLGTGLLSAAGVLVRKRRTV